MATLGRQVGVPVYTPSPNEKDVKRAASGSLEWAAEQSGNVQIFDTAGRQEIDEVLIEEIKRLKEFLKPQEVLLVADAATGQQAVSVATHFHAALGITGIVLDQARRRCPRRRRPLDARSDAAPDQVRRGW